MYKSKKNRSDFDQDYDDDYSKSKNDIKKDMNRRKEKHMKNALRTRNIQSIIDEEEFE